MAIFQKKSEEKEEKKTVKKTETLVTKTSKKGNTEVSALAEKVLMRPRITEKAYALNALSQYVFVVAPAATKESVKKAVEEAYSVRVTKVRIVRTPKKKRVSGQNRAVGFKKAQKKAIVSLEKGQSIELFKAGV